MAKVFLMFMSIHFITVHSLETVYIAPADWPRVSWVCSDGTSSTESMASFLNFFRNEIPPSKKPASQHVLKDLESVFKSDPFWILCLADRTREIKHFSIQLAFTGCPTQPPSVQFAEERGAATWALIIFASLQFCRQSPLQSASAATRSVIQQLDVSPSLPRFCTSFAARQSS